MSDGVLHLENEKIGVVLTKLTKAQAEYLGVAADRPCTYYRY